MTINKKKLKRIKKDTEEIKKNFDKADEGEQAAKELEEALVKINTEIDDRIDVFRSNLIRILRDLHQTRPFQIFSVINEQTDRIYALVDVISKTLDPVIDNFFRKETTECIKDITDICNKNIAEKWAKAKQKIEGTN